MICYLVVGLFLLHHASCMEGIVKTLAGGGYPHVGAVDTCVDGPNSVDGALADTRFNYPWGIVYDKVKHSVYVADCGCPDTPHGNDRVRRVDLVTDVSTTSAGSSQGFANGVGLNAQFFHIAGMALDHKRQKMYIADSGNNAIRVMDLGTNEVSTFSGTHTDKAFKDGSLLTARFDNPQQLEYDDTNDRLFIADTDNHAIRVINVDSATPKVTTLTGRPDMEGFKDGSFAEAKWRHPTGMAYDVRKDVLYVSDHYNHAVRVLDLKKQTVTTIAGGGKSGDVDQRIFGHGLAMNYPEGIAIDPEHEVLYVAEFGNNCIRMISLIDHSLTVLAGSESYGSRDAVGTDAQFFHPTGLDLDAERKMLYVTDQYNHRVRAITALGNTEVAQNSAMLIQHLGKVDAYRDLMVHNRSSVFASTSIIAICLFMILLWFTSRYWRGFAGRHCDKYWKMKNAHKL
ncbi:NHL repeat-containing protein 2 [Ciona intestinalis]